MPEWLKKINRLFHSQYFQSVRYSSIYVNVNDIAAIHEHAGCDLYDPACLKPGADGPSLPTARQAAPARNRPK
jgi:hypothetical protein